MKAVWATMADVNLQQAFLPNARQQGMAGLLVIETAQVVRNLVTETLHTPISLLDSVHGAPLLLGYVSSQEPLQQSTGCACEAIK